MSSLKDKVVIITGASGGIGEATALRLARCHAHLVLTSRDAKKLDEVKRKCIESGLDEDKILTLKADLTVDSDIEKIVNETVAKFGGIDVLINNAARLHYNLVINTDMAVFDDVMRINIRAPFYLSKLCMPHLVRSKGNIINVSSTSGERAYTGEAAYGVSKGALDHFTRILAMEAAENKVRINSVNPGVTRTDMQKKAGMSDEYYAEYVKTQGTLNPLGGVADPDQVAMAILFLAGEEAAFTTGQKIFVDGGRHTKPL